ncbi:MAG: HAD family phosphatase [Gemmatimonadales bacterium]
MKGVCFDFNGVIVDDERHHCAALLEVLAEWGLAVDESTYYREYLGYDDRGCFVHAWRAANRTLDTRMLDHLIAAKGTIYQRLIAADLTLVPGVGPFVRSLHTEGVRLAIVSAARREEIIHVLTIAGLVDCFVGIVAAEDVTRTKPDPEGYLKGLALLGLPTSACVVVEDSVPGLRAARAAGMPVAMLTTSHSRAELEREQPASIWADFLDHQPLELPWLPTSS